MGKRYMIWQGIPRSTRGKLMDIEAEAKVEQEARELMVRKVKEKESVLWMIRRLHVLKNFKVVDGQVKFEG